jgi:uncharacterized protein YdeI (YjbR/CyaY-like superfamily)
VVVLDDDHTCGVSWLLPSSARSSLVMPDGLRQALERHGLSFDGLSAAERRHAISLIREARTPQIRASRTAALVRHLSAGGRHDR